MDTYYPTRKVVLGLGNMLLGDEGFGIHAVCFLQDQLDGQFPVEWIDGGVLGLNLLPLVEECSHLLVLDIVDGGAPGGTVIELARSEIPNFQGVRLSEHQVDFQEVLATAKIREHYPTFLHLVGVQPNSLSPGIELSPCVKAAMAEAAWRARSVLQTWFGTDSRLPDEDTHPYHL